LIIYPSKLTANPVKLGVTVKARGQI